MIFFILGGIAFFLFVQVPVGLFVFGRLLKRMQPIERYAVFFVMFVLAIAVSVVAFMSGCIRRY